MMMPPAVARVAPTGVVVAVVCYCVWPYVIASSSGDAKQPAKLPEISAEVLLPKIAAPPQRDPFQMAGGAGGGVGGGVGGGGGAAGKRATPRPAAERPQKAADPLAGLVLGATCIGGSGRLAVINGQVYRLREKLSLTGTTASWLVAEILPDKVRLESQGKSVELKYPDIHAAPAGGKGDASGASRGKPPASSGRAPRARDRRAR